MKTRPLFTALATGVLAAAVALGGTGLAAPAQASTTATAVTVRTSSFPDVSASNQFRTEIAWLSRTGITTGWDDGTFRPKSAITREAMAAFLYRFAGEPSYKAPAKSAFRDVSHGNKFYKEISWLAETGVSTGWDDGTFRPKNRITREAMAAFLYRYSGKIDTAAAGGSNRLKDVSRSNQFHSAIDWLARTGITTGWTDGTFRPENFITREAMAAFLYRYDRDDLPTRHFAVNAQLITPQVLDATNRHRSAEGRAALSAYLCLADLALHNAEAQAAKASMHHVGNLKQAMKGCDSYAAAENVAMGQRSPKAAVDAWWHSSGHRTNMLNSIYRGMAAAVAFDDAGRPYYSQVFSGARH